MMQDMRDDSAQYEELLATNASRFNGAEEEDVQAQCATSPNEDTHMDEGQEEEAEVDESQENVDMKC
jgi:hypothetical protein